MINSYRTEWAVTAQRSNHIVNITSICLALLLVWRDARGVMRGAMKGKFMETATCNNRIQNETWVKTLVCVK